MTAVPSLLPLLAFFLAAAPAFAADAPSGTVVRMGVLDFESEASYLGKQENIQETIIGYLRAHSPGLRIQTRFYTTPQLADAVRRGDVEFFLGSSGFFVEMRPYGVRDIGTIVSNSFPNPNQCVAGVMIVRKDRFDLSDLKSLKDATAVTTSRRNFMTFQLNMGEIAAQGFDPDGFFKDIIETDNRPIEVMRAVAEGRADVGLLRACMPEAITAAHPEFRGIFRTVNDHPGPRAERLGCRYSTDMYPGWTIAAAPHTPPVITRHVATTLLKMRPEETPSGFFVSFATEFNRVNSLFQTLKTGPYEHLRHWTVRRFLSVAWPFLLFAAGLAGAWILHSVRLERLVEKRTRDLREALVRERAAEAHAAEIGAKLDKAQRAGIVGQLSSIFAHELGQPLSAMTYYTRGLKTLLKKPSPDPALTERCLTGLSDELGKAGEILDRVRSYAKSGAKRETPLDLTELIRATHNDLVKSRRLRVPVDIELPEALPVRGDPVELRILITNLLKNAQEAMADLPEGVIRVRAAADDRFVSLTVANPGPVLSPEAVAAIGQPLATSKSTGLGLGLLICKSIAEAHRASLTFIGRSAESGGGLCVTLAVPLRNDDIPDNSSSSKNTP